jgi:hemolysin D
MVANNKTPNLIKILVVDDQKVVREKLKSVLQEQPDLQVVGTAVDGYGAIERIEQLQPDVILLDLDMPGMDGLKTAKIISQQYPQLKIIILSSYDDAQNITKALAGGANGYIVKDQIGSEIGETIRSVQKGYTQLGPGLFEKILPPGTTPANNVVELDRARTNLSNRASGHTRHPQPHPPLARENVAAPTQINRDSEFVEVTPSQFTESIQTSLSKLNDWSNAAKELIDTMPLPWTRGLLYFLLVFIGIFLPWSFFYKMDEIGSARGRLELKGNTIKREADIDGSVAVVKVFVKKGDVVKAGQTIMELDAKNVREQLYQNQIKLDGGQQRLNHLVLMKNQMGLGTNAQEQQNQAQILEKQSQVAQAQQSITALNTNAETQAAEKLAQVHQAEQALIDRQSSYNLQKAEKLTQVRQSQQGILDAQTAHILAQNRLKDAEKEVKRYAKLYQTGAVPEVKLKEVESIAQERQQLLSQAVASLEQAKLRLKEQQNNYQTLVQQGQADIAQARLRLKEQQKNHQRVLNQAQADLAQAKLRLTEQQRGADSLAKGGNLSIIRTEQQLKELESQIVTLQSEIDRDKAQSAFLTRQLNKYTIKADADGTIFELPIEREGAVIQPKQLIAEIAPTTNGLVFKGEIAATQSESLRSGDTEKEVKLKFDEFPFESYDVVKGKLTWIAPNSKLTPTPQGNLATYDIEVKLDRDCVNYQGKCIPFKSGQPATAEIVIRNRRIIDFVLDPFKKLSNGQ